MQQELFVILTMSPKERESRRHSEDPGNNTRGAILRGLRSRLGLSQGELAHKAHRSQVFLSQVENDEVESIGFEACLRLAKSLGVGVGFWNGTQSEKVFLQPLASEIAEVINNPSLPEEIRENLLREMQEVTKHFPNPLQSNLTYIDLDQIPEGRVLGSKIRGLRTKLGMSQGELAAETQIRQGSLSQIETGDVNFPTFAVMSRIAQAVNVDIEELLEHLGVIHIIHVPEEISAIDLLLRDPRLDYERIRKVIIGRVVQYEEAIQQATQDQYNLSVLKTY